MCCRTNILRTISTRAENKENKLPDIENPAPVAESAADCSICLEKFYGDAVKINIGVLTSCGHYFHFECLWEWLRMQLSCPICRNKIRWSERDIRAVTYARILEDTSQQAGISFVPRGEEDTHSVTSVESLEYSGCFPRLTNRVLPAVHQTRTEQQDHQRQHRIQRILSVQETLSNVALAQVYFIWRMVAGVISLLLRSIYWIQIEMTISSEPVRCWHIVG